MRSHFFAYTPPEEDMPPYVNVSIDGRQGLRVMIRGPKKDGTYGACAQVMLPREEAEKLHAWLGEYLARP